MRMKSFPGFYMQNQKMHEPSFDVLPIFKRPRFLLKKHAYNPKIDAYRCALIALMCTCCPLHTSASPSHLTMIALITRQNN